MIKVSEIRSYGRRAMLMKAAAYGDVVNAGVGSMAMGSPFAPRPYTPGTSNLKPTEQVQREQRNSAVAGAAALAPFGAKAIGPSGVAGVAGATGGALLRKAYDRAGSAVKRVGSAAKRYGMPVLDAATPGAGAGTAIGRMVRRFMPAQATPQR